MEERYLHEPVLIGEVIRFLNPEPGKIIVDATIGGAGHAKEILHRITPGGFLVGIDRDSESLKIAYERLKLQKGLFELRHGNFRDLKQVLADLNIKEVDGILMDLGISSIQLEKAERGFSIKSDGPLDMRMDREKGITARDIINGFTEGEISDLIKEFGEERFHRRIARGILAARKKKNINTTGELTEIILRSLPYRKGREKIHPATRTFQALRIKVNEELTVLEEALLGLPGVIKKGGRICVISFHSLEDRIVKNALREFKAKGTFRILTKKPVVAGETEVLKNPRARSSKLRAAERIL